MDCLSTYRSSILLQTAKFLFHSSTAVVQLTVNQLVVGSIPACGANIGDVMELVYVLVLEAKFCEFESHRPHQFALLV